MPVEIVQRHIGCIRNSREGITHDLTGLYLIVAGLFNRHTKLRGLVVGGKLNDLIGIHQTMLSLKWND